MLVEMLVAAGAGWDAGRSAGWRANCGAGCNADRSASRDAGRDAGRDKCGSLFSSPPPGTSCGLFQTFACDVL